MRNIKLLFIAFTVFLSCHLFANEPDSAYIFSYSTLKNGGRNGLHFAWSTDRLNWFSIGPELRYLFCDYGRWGAEKRLITPFLFHDNDKIWHCIWTLNEKDGSLAHATSKDLIYWTPQTYPVLSNGNCQYPEISFKQSNGEYLITWINFKGTYASDIFGSFTKDFKTYTPSKQLSSDFRLNSRESILISGNSETGTIHKVEWKVIENLLIKKKSEDFKRIQSDESTKEDPVRFADLKPVDATITINLQKSKKISNMLIGIFFEDINYAADGGLYAELIQNRDFEYALSDKESRDLSWNNYKAWSLYGNGSTFVIDTIKPIHPNNKHFAILHTERIGASLVNEGFDGIAVKAGELYDFSTFVRNTDKKSKKLKVCLVNEEGEILAETSLNIVGCEWNKVSTTLTVRKTATDAKLEIIPQTIGDIHLDLISLFPQKTFKNRKNGLRADLAQTIADIHPRFVRFPGGCVAHGDGLRNIYRWENTIGSLESRLPQRNLWGYHQTAGLGYFEYFQFCEDIGAEPVPVVAAGVPCQNSATGGAGQQGGIPMCDMDHYVQDVLNLIEWANGDVKTKWGKIRAESGHPKPFNLKYIGVGNEDLINDIFEERFTMIYHAVKEKHPEITVIGTVGPTFEGTDYVEGWKIATKLNVPMVDEHYYQSPGWFINNHEYYDKYDRSKSKVYLGEYAAHLPGRPVNIETALAEAHYLTALERNGDVVSMASYAPLLAKEGFTQWTPDLIYFNNAEIKPTVGYYVQKLFGQNSGDEYISSDISLSNNRESVRKRLAVSVVRDTRTNDLILKLVNLLPIAVNSTLNLKEFKIENLEATQIQLKGNPTDKNAKPEISAIKISNLFTTELPAYSFTVIRVKTSN